MVDECLCVLVVELCYLCVVVKVFGVDEVGCFVIVFCGEVIEKEYFGLGDEVDEVVFVLLYGVICGWKKVG